MTNDERLRLLYDGGEANCDRGRYLYYRADYDWGSLKFRLYEHVIDEQGEMFFYLDAESLFAAMIDVKPLDQWEWI